ncbi:permease-like cell division protein FtsX [Quadrisphaera sp. DSM 44207]|uniref:permease-like cell division protein FtsX n=1 Tax=Quadrisphaera sp. DSM 44207 TaxID=1881057 RepID=UPI00087EBCD0|nr:permease-like cell division protein FtsX [Quadrisphaera sp. DSM 44207]SDQ72782.1 cell division protein FtsX [Quadrisphaera sp. DSM 44207]
MRLQYILGEILVGLRRNTAMTVSVVLVTFVSLVFVGAGALLQMQIAQMKGYWYDRVQVSIYLCVADSEAPTCTAGEVTQAQREEVVAALDSPTLAPYVEEHWFESKEEAFGRFQEQFAGTAIADSATADQMPESYRVKLVDPTQYDVVSQYFAGVQGVEEVQDQRRVLDRFFAVLNVLTAVSGGFAVVMIAAAALLIATTIRLAAYSRRRETGIMRLVGASKALIQLPFLLEGVLAAVVGAALATAALWAGVRFGVQGWLVEVLPLFSYIGTAQVWLVAPLLFAVGVLLSGAASVVTLSRYLRV